MSGPYKDKRHSHAMDGEKVKPRLLFVSRKWPPAVGGMETYSVELHASLEPNFEITRKVLPGRPNGRPPGLLAYAAFLLKITAYCLLYANRFERVVFGDLVLYPAALCCRLRAPSQKRLVVVYGLDLVYFRRKGLLPRAYGAYFWLFRKTQTCFSAIVAISTFTATLAHEAGLERVHVVPPSLPKTALTEDAGAAAVAIPEAFSKSRSRRILHFGRLVPRKGAAWFANQVLPRLDADVEFFVAGSSYDPSVLQILESTPRTTYLGPQPPDALAAMIRQADIVVMPNVSTASSEADVEGFGLVAVETASLGGLLLASRLQGLADAVVEGVTGSLLPPDDAATWAISVQKVLQEPAVELQRLRDAARAQTRTIYSKERMSAALAALL